MSSCTLRPSVFTYYLKQPCSIWGGISSKGLNSIIGDNCFNWQLNPYMLLNTQTYFHTFNCYRPVTNQHPDNPKCFHNLRPGQRLKHQTLRLQLRPQDAVSPETTVCATRIPNIFSPWTNLLSGHALNMLSKHSPILPCKAEALEKAQKPTVKAFDMTQMTQLSNSLIDSPLPSADQWVSNIHVQDHSWSSGILHGVHLYPSNSSWAI